jgi:hypothetical protein
VCEPAEFVADLERQAELAPRSEERFFGYGVMGLALPAWEARLGAAGTIPREERASREYVFDPDRFRELSRADAVPRRRRQPPTRSSRPARR